MFEWRPCICPAAFIKLNLQQPVGTHERFLRRAAKSLSHRIRLNMFGLTPARRKKEPVPGCCLFCLQPVPFISVFNSGPLLQRLHLLFPQVGYLSVGFQPAVTLAQIFQRGSRWQSSKASR